nr:TPA_asm: ND4 [Gammarus wautieri]
MLGIFMSAASGLMMSGVWGESMIWMLCVSGVFLMSSSDSLSWKGGLSGELDYIGWGLMLLSVWIGLMAVMGSKSVKIGNYLSSFFIVLNVSLLVGFVVSFYVSDFMMFYLSYESCLVPIFFLILGWGYQPERAQAGIYMLFYTLFGSLPLFFFIIKGTSVGCSYMHNMSMFWPSGGFFFVFLIGAFLIKFPMYSMHLWLLKAHVEAPLAGSMLLAGVMLKLGGYGLIRFLSIWPERMNYFSEFILCLSTWGGVVISLSCLRQMDMKLLIASSSVVHMSMCVSGLLVLSEWGLKGSLFIMIAHGLCSSGLFYLAGVVYERSCSRSLIISKGLLSVMPSVSFCWFMLLVANMAGPPTLNLAGELLLMIALVSVSKYLMIILGFMSFFSASYSLYLFSLSQHGVSVTSKSGFCSGFMVEHLVSSCHWLPLNVMIFCLFWLV